MVQLLEPDPAYERSYDSYVQELHAAGAPPVPFTLGYDHAVFAALVERLRRPTTGGRWVPNSNYWFAGSRNSGRNSSGNSGRSEEGGEE